MRTTFIVAFWLALAGPAAAAVVDAQPGGFEVREEAVIAAPPAKVYAALSQIGRWWSSEHTYSHDGRNLTIELAPGGCFCERWGGNAVQHMRVTVVEPDALVRLEGALGPLASTGGSGRMTITLAAKGDGTEVVMVYDFGGYAKDGLKDWAGPVDGVLGLQVTRLKQFVETGRPAN